MDAQQQSQMMAEAQNVFGGSKTSDDAVNNAGNELRNVGKTFNFTPDFEIKSDQSFGSISSLLGSALMGK